MIKVYITFGQNHRHVIRGETFDKDCVGILVCQDFPHATELLDDYFHGVYANVYVGGDKKRIDMDYYPRGFIHIN